MRRYTAFGLIAGAFILLGCNSDRLTSEADARRLAADALAEYCETEKLAPSQFNLTKIGPAGDSPWLLVYVSSGIKPVHEVVVDIDRKGNLNVGRFIRDEE